MVSRRVVSKMAKADKSRPRVCVEDASIPGHAQLLDVRSFLPAGGGLLLPIVLYFQGGGFISRSLPDSDKVAYALARDTPAWVISVCYSLAPEFPFPVPLEDGYRALLWAIANAHAQGADPTKIAVAGHDAGGNLATCLAAMVRDRGQAYLSGQVLIAPLLDPSLTRIISTIDERKSDLDLFECAKYYRAYLPHPLQRMHPYVAPIESRRLSGLAPTFIANAEHDLFRGEADAYATALITAGVVTISAQYSGTTHQTIFQNSSVIKDVVTFLTGCFAMPVKALDDDDQCCW